MKKMMMCVLGGILLWAGLGLAVAQEETAATTPPPKVMQIIREFVKPGRAGAVHERSESAFVQAFTRAKWPTHYFAATSITGKPRALFFVPYGSFGEWEKDAQAQQKNATLAAALDRASMADGNLLDSMDTHLLVYNEEQSLRAPVDIAHMRYFEIYLYQIRPGHRSEWNDLVKLVKAAYEKIPETHWAMYESVYGQQDATYLVIVPLKSAAEIDQDLGRDKQFVENMGEDGMKKLSELESSAIDLTMSNLFQFAPAMSYPPDAWVKADPEFWRARPSAKAPAKTQEKPATKP